jgi:ribosomal RNA assembly protein
MTENKIEDQPEDIRKLAETLKASGLAASDTDAIEKARASIGAEKVVQKAQDLGNYFEGKSKGAEEAPVEKETVSEPKVEVNNDQDQESSEKDDNENSEPVEEKESAETSEESQDVEEKAEETAEQESTEEINDNEEIEESSEPEQEDQPEDEQKEDIEGANLEQPMEEELSYQLKIPGERVAVLVGTDGENKSLIEKEAEVRIHVTKDGEIDIYGEDGLKLYTSLEIVRAIGRGFNPKYALELLKTDYVLDIIRLKDIAGKSQKTMERLKGRVIGKAGRSRENIERLTNCYISVYGKTIGIIGETVDVSLAHQAIAMLLQGSMHKTVFTFLEKKRKEIMYGQEG